MHSKQNKKYVLYAVLICLVGFQIYPIVWLILSSFKSSIELTTKPFAFPTTFHFGNYASVIVEGTIFRYINNTAIVTITSILLILILSALAGFALSKMDMKFNKKLRVFFTLGIMIPVQITLIPLFSMYKNMGLLNSYFALILPQVGFALPLSILIFTSFYEFLPDQIIEAAVIDGCGIAKILHKIVLPLTRNTMITVASLNFILIWNDFIFSNTFTSDAAYKTIAVGLQDYIGAFGATDWGMTFAAISTSILPIIILYLILNKNIMAGISAGSVKG